MWKIIGILFFICAQILSAYADDSPGYIIQGEYKHDTLDYNDEEKTFYRSSVTINLSEKSSFNASHLYIAKDHNHRFAFYLDLMDISDSFKTVVGNFNINYGAGLLMGKKKLVDPDIFSRNIITIAEKSATPCANTNPAYCFQGLTSHYYARFDSFIISLNAFYSIRNRYTETGTYESGQTSSSITSLENKLDASYSYNEPVYLHDRGIMAQCAEKNFSMQLYYFNTELHDSANTRIAWNYSGDYPEKAMHNSHNYGLYAQYRDDYITLFLEYGIPGNKTARADAYARNYGMLWGVRYTHQLIGASLAYRDTGENFYAPLAAGTNYAEKAWTFSDYLKLHNRLTLRSEIYSNKKQAIYYGSYLPVARRESISCTYHLSKLDFLRLKASKAQSDDGIEEKVTYQYKPQLRLTFFTSLQTETAAVWQHLKDNGTSRAYSGSVSDVFFRYLKLTVAFSQLSITAHNAIYSYSSSFYNSISSGFYVKETSQLAELKLSFTHKQNIIAIRYIKQFRGKKDIHKRLEIFGKVVF